MHDVAGDLFNKYQEGNNVILAIIKHWFNEL